MSRLASPRLRAYCLLSAALLTAALVTGRPELVALAAPFLVFLAAALANSREPDLSVAVALDRQRALEGEAIRVVVTVAAAVSGCGIELALSLPAGIGPARAADGPPLWRFRLDPSEQRTLELAVSARRWGTYRLAGGSVRAWDRAGLFVWEAAIEPVAVVRVYPRPERLRALIAPRATQTLVGSRVARSRGDGVEFADIRPFVAGDRVRRVNWRATARRGALHVNEQHPERNADVVLFLDTFEEARAEALGTLDLMLRAATSLAAAYLQRRDRVGVVGFGGVLQWLEPSLGERALYRIADALLQTEIVFSYVWKTVSVIPARLLPAGSLVIALTPLLDPRASQALLDLRARGYDLAIIECSPEALLAAPSSPQDELARRLWTLQRAALRSRLRELGVPVARWNIDQPLPAAVAEVISSRHHARRTVHA